MVNWFYSNFKLILTNEFQIYRVKIFSSNFVFEIVYFSLFDQFFKMYNKGVAIFGILLCLICWLDCVALNIVQKGKAQVFKWLLIK